jgi:hypothetical protein
MNKSNNQKKIIPLSINTIDEKHTEMLNRFETIEKVTIPELISEKAKLKTIIPTLKEAQIDEYMDICDKIEYIRSQIRALKTQKKQYLLENSKYIFDYFEQKKQISNGAAPSTQNVNVLNSFFKIKSKTSESSDLTSEKYTQSKKAYQNYWRNVNNEITNIQDFIVNTDVCERGYFDM